MGMTATPEQAIVGKAVEPFLFGAVQLKDVNCDRSIGAKRDAFGNDGTLVLEKFDAVAVSMDDRDTIIKSYLDAGFTELPRDSLKDDDQKRFRLDQLDPSNPFVWEHEVEVAVGGRSLVGSQRSVLAKKLTSLREELTSDSLKPKRREEAERMIEELEAGLLLRITVELSRRSFVMKPLLSNGCSMGEVLPLEFMSQLVYNVVPADPDEREEDDGESLYITLLGADERQASFLFSGGILGQRTVTDLEEGKAHHAWFQNRQVSEAPDTAPWVSRRVHRELKTTGESSLVVKWGREDEPLHLKKTGEEELTILVHGEERSLPVIVAETEKEDRLWILDDEASPLVLKMIEEEADLLRTIDEVRKLDAF